MAFVIGLLTFFLVTDCLLLILLVLIQLPKKEAGVGVAFGGAATDALFGAGSGNVLTKATKYLAGAFFVLGIALSIMQTHMYHRTSTEFRRELEMQGHQAPAPTAPSTPAPNTAIPNTPAPAVSLTNGLNLLQPVPATTNPAPGAAPK